MDDQKGGAWFDVGRHACREEPAEELFFIRLQGNLFDEDGWTLGAAMQRFIRDGRTRCFLMIDVSAMGNVPSSTRKAIAEGILNVPIAGSAIFGASFATKVVATLANRTINLLRRERRYDTRYFSTEEQARAWLAQKRSATPKP